MSITGFAPSKRALFEDWGEQSNTSSQLGSLSQTPFDDDNQSTSATISLFLGYKYNVRIIDPNTPRDFSHIQQLLLGNRPIPAVVSSRYETLEQLADNVRLHNVPAPGSVGTLSIRFAALQQSGSARGFGADELLMTSQTDDFFRRSAGKVQGVETHSILQDGTRFSWLDAQFNGRVPTAMVLFRNGHGHVGALFRHATSTSTTGGQRIIGQHDFHRDRQVEVYSSTSPLLGIYRALHFTRKETISVSELVKGEMYLQPTFNVFDEDMQNPTQRRAFAYDVEAFRNNIIFALNLIRGQMSADELAELSSQSSLQFSDVDAEAVTIDDLGLPPMQLSDGSPLLKKRRLD